MIQLVKGSDFVRADTIVRIIAGGVRKDTVPLPEGMIDESTRVTVIQIVNGQEREMVLHCKDIPERDALAETIAKRLSDRYLWEHVGDCWMPVKHGFQRVGSNVASAYRKAEYKVGNWLLRRRQPPVPATV